MIWEDFKENDYHPLDHLTVGNYNGIHVKNLSDWLLGAEQ